MEHTATYSPEDNKLRLYPAQRLDAELYARVKAAGFKWAPKQELFVAPMWTPERAELLEELCGDIDDEGQTLAERQAARAERFEGYQENRTRDAHRAHAAVAAIADNIPFGQPILVGHHSERHARRDAEKIRAGMSRAVKMWDTAGYWKTRAEGALFHAKYKELPGVRARRIKGLESDLRKFKKSEVGCASVIAYWSKDPTPERAAAFARNRYFNVMCDDGVTERSLDLALEAGQVSLQNVQGQVLSTYTRTQSRIARWISHTENRLAYEKAMLGESGGLEVDGVDMQPGGSIALGSERLVILRVTRKEGRIVSVTTVAPRHWGGRTRVCQVEDVRGYEPPAEGMAEKVATASKIPPLCNFPGEGFHEMTAAEWTRRHKDAKQTLTRTASEKHGAHRVRITYGTNWKRVQVFLTDAPIKHPPAPTPTPEAPAPQMDAAAMRAEAERLKARAEARDAEKAEAAPFDALKAALKAGVQVVAANQLFPTPPALAARMASMLGAVEGETVLEPSAGTGALVAAVEAVCPGALLWKVEANPALAARVKAFCCDFLTCDFPPGHFDRVIMNPPFENGSDVKHILHALKYVRKGGRLVAICANGPRQNATLKPLAATWEELPAGTFDATSVRTVLLTIEA